MDANTRALHGKRRLHRMLRGALSARKHAYSHIRAHSQRRCGAAKSRFSMAFWDLFTVSAKVKDANLPHSIFSAQNCAVGLSDDADPASCT